MILASLRDLAIREELVSEPAFESKGVRWVIHIDPNGEFVSLESTLSDPVADEHGRRPRPQPMMMSIPRRVIRTGKNFRPDFLADKSEYVLGVLPDESQAAQDPSKSVVCTKRFVDLISHAAQDCGSPLLHSAELFLRNPEQRGKCIAELNTNRWASNDLLTFSCDLHLLTTDRCIRDWWRSQYQKLGLDKTASAQCVICGQRCVPVKNHDPVKVPGAQSKGVSLVSFENQAFWKYGHEKSDNAPVCRSCMNGYVEGLRRCLSDRYPDPHRPGESLAQQAVVLNPDTKRRGNSLTTIYWTDKPWSMAGQLSWLRDRPADLKAELESPKKGIRALPVEGTFYCVILSGAQGRAILRSMHTGTVAQVEESLRRYFDSLHLEGIAPDQPLPLFVLVKALAPREKLDRLPPTLPGHVFLHAVLGRPLPRLILNAAVNRNRAEQRVTSARAVLLQLYFSTHRPEVPHMSLDTEFRDPGYLFGRLFAVLERVQSLANPGVNTTIVDRFYGAASTRPGTVFPQLFRLNQAHLAKVPSDRNRDWYRKITGEIMDGFPAEFTSTLGLDQQGAFALGYYHQRQFFYRKAVAPQEATDENATETTEGGES